MKSSGKRFRAFLLSVYSRGLVFARYILCVSLILLITLFL